MASKSVNSRRNDDQGDAPYVIAGALITLAVGGAFWFVVIEAGRFLQGVPLW